MKELKKLKSSVISFWIIKMKKMKKETVLRFLLPIGLLMTTLVTGRIMHVPDVVEGFFKGLGLTLMIGSLLLQRKKQLAARKTGERCQE